MRQQAVPTAEARSFTDAGAAEEFVRTRNVPCVIKAAGLAKGKGVSVCRRPEDALEAIYEVLAPESLIGCGAGGVIGQSREIETGSAVSVWAASSTDRRRREGA